MHCFEFLVDDKSRAFCDEIIREMQSRLGVTESEALGRMNQLWKGVDFEGDDLRFHETADFWAMDIYYGHGSFWWTQPPGLKPIPFP
jgi:hypothetical protein